MAASAHTWRAEGRALPETATFVVAAVIGLTLAVGFHRFEGSGVAGARAGFRFGLILLAASLGMLASSARQIVTVEPTARRILVEQRSRLGTSTKTIGFDEIAGMSVGEHGDGENGGTRYYVEIKLKTGEAIALFHGFFEGSFTRSAMETRRQLLIGYLKATE